jgi:molybdopterin molybdotransferase
VKRALEQNGVSELFYRINQKPGKPMYVGVKEGKLIFALPGNPASLLTCFYIYLLPALRYISGQRHESQSLRKKLVSGFEYRVDRPVFLKALISGEYVEILEGQMSFVLKSFAEANALVYLHGENRMIKKESEVEVFPII